MQDPTQNIDMTRDTIRVTRPDGFTGEQWTKLQADLTEGFDAIVEKVSGRCRTYDWCTMASNDDHEHFHASDTIDLAGSNLASAGPDETAVGWWAWAVADRDKLEPHIVLEGNPTGEGARSTDLLSGVLADLLDAIATPEAHQRLRQLVDAVIGSA